MKLRLVGKIRRADTTWYVAYSETGQLVEFSLMPDTSPKVVGTLNAALPVPVRVESVIVDTNDIQKFHALKEA
jgi:hypothetical protein